MTTALQTTLYNALTSDATLMALVKGVYDIAPIDTPFPYLTLGADALRSAATKTSKGVIVTASISVWSSAQGRSEAKNILTEVVRVLDGASLTGAVSCHYLDSQTRLISRERLIEGVVRFRIRL